MKGTRNQERNGYRTSLLPIILRGERDILLNTASLKLEVWILKMVTRRTRYSLSLAYVSVALSGLFLLAWLTLNPPILISKTPFHKQVIGLIFTAICLFGIILGISPSRFSRITHIRSQKKKDDEAGRGNSRSAYKGHHPVCGNFSSHVLTIRGKPRCAGCTGLVIGAIISLLGSLLYFFLDFRVGETATLVFWLGFGSVVCGLLQYHILMKQSLVHFLVNVVFVFGAFLLLVGVSELASSPVLEAYLFALMIYWIITRIMLSQREHEKICAACGLKSCAYL